MKAENLMNNGRNEVNPLPPSTLTKFNRDLTVHCTGKVNTPAAPVLLG